IPRLTDVPVSLGAPGVRQRNCHLDDSSGAARADFQATAQLSYAFLHPGHADPNGYRASLVLVTKFGRGSPSLVSNAERDCLLFITKPNLCRWAIRMTLDVREAFLDNAEQCDLRVLRQP